MAGQVRYGCDVYTSGVQATTGAIAFTLRTSQIAGTPNLGGQFVRAAEGKVESQAWKLKIVDVGSTFTAQIANSSGRMNLLGRLVRFRSSLNTDAETNYCLQSQALATSPWFTTLMTATNNAATASDGTLTATSLVPAAVLGSHIVEQLLNITVGENTSCVAEFKANGYTGVTIKVDGGTGNYTAAFDLSAGTATQLADFGAGYHIKGATITNLGSGWYRCAVWGTTGTDASLEPTIVVYDTGAHAISQTGFTGDGVSGMFCSRVQFQRNGTVLLTPPQNYVATTTVPVSAYTTLNVGRLTDISLDQSNPAHWNLSVQDERFLERDLQIFTRSNTAMILPKGTVSPFMNVTAPTDPKLTRFNVTWVSGNLVFLQYAGSIFDQSGGLIGEGGRAATVANYFSPQLVIDDVKPNPIVPNGGMTVGNFLTLRWHNNGDGVDREVAFFATSFEGLPVPSINAIDALLRRGTADPVQFAVIWTAGPPAQGSVLNGYLYMPGHIASADLPLHLGGTNGLHPAKVVRNAYDGIYNPPGSTTIKIRYSTAAFDAWQKDPSYGRVWFRITAPESMASFLEKRIFGPYGMLPLINSSGKITPTRAWPPTSSGVAAILPIISSTNAVDHPTWEQGSREAITALRLRYDYYGIQLDKDGQRTLASAADGIVGLTHESTRLADSAARLGRQELSWTMGAIYGAGQLPVPNFRFNSSQLLPNAGYGETHTSILAKHIFARFSDGPLYASVQCLRSIDATTHGTVNPGDYVKLNIGTWPNPFTRTRGGARILQVVQRDDGIIGPKLRLLDFGSTQAALAVPGLALAATTNGDSSRHSFKLTVSNVPAGAVWLSMVAMTTSTGGTLPGTSSPAWKWLAGGSTVLLTFNAGQRPSNTKHFVRVRALKLGRIMSAWSSAPSRVTAKIPGPSGMTAAGLTRGTAILKWTDGSSQYPLEVMVDSSTASALGTSDRVDVVPPATTRYLLEGLNNVGKEKAGVRHNDAWGGFSSMATVIISGTSALPRTTAPIPRGFHPLPPRF